MSNDVVIKVENASKKFSRSLRHMMYYGVKDIARGILGIPSGSDKLRNGEFWAVDDVSFELKKGETLGIIGPNGSGKTTILKMLNGIFMPDKGRIEVRGKVGALIEIGAGFHPMLTGRENIYVNGAILGMSKKEIDKKFDSIVDFADIGDFLDSPVKHYSSGMYVRLGFAVAVHCEPDILLVDEILAVGDVGFRAKCYNRIAELVENCAVIIVSHNMASIARITNKVMLLNQGIIQHFGQGSEGIRKYNDLFEFGKEMIMNNSASISEMRIKNATFHDYLYRVSYGDSIEIEIDVNFLIDVDQPVINLHFMDFSQQYVFQTNSFADDYVFGNVKKGKYQITLKTPNLFLNPGKYTCSVVVFNKKQIKFLAWSHSIMPFEVAGKFVGVSAYQGNSEWHIEKLLP